MLVKFSKFNLDLDPPGFQDVYEDDLATVPGVGDLVFVDGASTLPNPLSKRRSGNPIW